MNEIMLAAIDIGGKGFINQLVTLLIYGICVGLIYAAGLWFFRRPSIPPIAITIWNGLFILLGLVIILNFLLGLGGKQFIEW